MEKTTVEEETQKKVRIIADLAQELLRTDVEPKIIAIPPEWGETFAGCTALLGMSKEQGVPGRIRILTDPMYGKYVEKEI